MSYVQIHLKTSQITASDWENAYREIEQLVAAFPVPLVRIESYNGYSPELNKEHRDLYVGRGTQEEHISFFADAISFTAGFSVRIYRDWGKEKELALLGGKEIDPERSIVWHPNVAYQDDGALPEANAPAMGYGYVDTGGAFYGFAVLAIGVLLENLMPGRAWLTATEYPADQLHEVVAWLDGLFGRSHEMPLYWDRERLLLALKGEYENAVETVGRFQRLYNKQFKRNMLLTLKEVGYAPSFEYYASALAKCSFATFGFLDILNAWIAATADLESMLEIVAASKQLLDARGDDDARKEAAAYDLPYLLKHLLLAYVLWTPQQRELLDLLPNSKEALETGDEDLMGSILRMTGFRVDICPIYATKDELFEAFMYHDPSRGAAYLTIIEDWISKNITTFDDKRRQLLEAIEGKGGNQRDPEDLNPLHTEITAFVQQYPEHERFLIANAIAINPAYLHFDKGLARMYAGMRERCMDAEGRKSLRSMYMDTAAGQRKWIRAQLKEKEYSVHPDFEQWLAHEEDRSVRFHLCLLLAFKLTHRDAAYVRVRVLFDRTYWDAWRPEGAFWLGEDHWADGHWPHV